jgi:hypothetical protein
MGADTFICSPEETAASARQEFASYISHFAEPLV